MPESDGPTTTTRCTSVIGAIKSQGTSVLRRRLLRSQDRCGCRAATAALFALALVVNCTRDCPFHYLTDKSSLTAKGARFAKQRAEKPSAGLAFFAVKKEFC